MKKECTACAICKTDFRNCGQNKTQLPCPCANEICNKCDPKRNGVLSQPELRQVQSQMPGLQTLRKVRR